ncbi:hypothetical protein [Bacillus phage SWEP1]|nr:hypothetical protein [Bacillus phage SWEP1]
MKYQEGFEFEINVGTAYADFGFDLHTGTTAKIIDISTSTKKPYIIEDEYGNFIMPVTEEELTSLVAHPIFPSRKDKLAQWTVVLSKFQYGGDVSEVFKCMSKAEVKNTLKTRASDYNSDDVLVFPPLSNIIANDLYKEEL